MAAPNAWQTAYGVVVSLDGKSYQTINGEFHYSIAKFDTTNDQGGGYVSFGLAEKSVSLRGTSPLDTLATNKKPAVGSYISFSFNDGEKTYSGNGYITELSGKWGGKGGYTFDWTLDSTGTVTIA